MWSLLEKTLPQKKNHAKTPVKTRVKPLSNLSLLQSTTCLWHLSYLNLLSLKQVEKKASAIAGAVFI
jgi:hypothetical protein